MKVVVGAGVPICTNQRQDDRCWCRCASRYESKTMTGVVGAGVPVGTNQNKKVIVVVGAGVRTGANQRQQGESCSWWRCASRCESKTTKLL